MGIKPLTSLEQFGAKMRPFRLLGGAALLVFASLVMWGGLNPWIAILSIGVLTVSLSASLGQRPSGKTPFVATGQRRSKEILQMPENGIDSLCRIYNWRILWV